MEQGETQGVVVGFVPAIFAVVHYRSSVAAVLVGEVGPALGIYFISCGGVVATFHAAYSEIVGGFFIVEVKGEFGFDECILGFPVNFIEEIDAVCKRTFVQPDVLAESGIAMTLSTQSVRRSGPFSTRVMFTSPLIETGVASIVGLRISHAGQS